MTELLNCTGLSKAYGKKRALDHVDLHLEPGKIIGLLGPNGSGKTTLMKLANGLLQPTEGSITIAGSVPGPATKEIVSYLPDAAWLPDWMRVEQLVEMFHDFYADFDPARAGEMLAKLELDKWKEERANKLKAKAEMNRQEEEKAIESAKADMECANPWERVVKLVDMSAEVDRDMSRMKQVMIRMKSDAASM